MSNVGPIGGRKGGEGGEGLRLGLLGLAVEDAGEAPAGPPGRPPPVGHREQRRDGGTGPVLWVGERRRTSGLLCQA